MADLDMGRGAKPEIDTLDLQIVDALRIDGRASFSTLAKLFKTSDQTVARRYRRLKEEAGLRVAGLPDGFRLGWDQWLIRLQTTPDSAWTIAGALAKRSDTTWVTIASGGAEVTCIVKNPGTADRETLLLQKLPRTPRLVSVRAYWLMHYFAGGPVGGLPTLTSLTPEQIAAIAPPGPATDATPVLDDADRPLVDALARDGRLGYPQLATATGWSESTVRRRLEQLRASGAIFFDVETDPAVLGYPARFLLWLSVAPRHLAAVGEAMAAHREVVFAAACTGDTNLVATVICPDMRAMYEYLTRRVGSLPGVTNVESVPMLRHLKQVAAVI